MDVDVVDADDDMRMKRCWVDELLMIISCQWTVTVDANDYVKDVDVHDAKKKTKDSFYII